jgi:hypothetical protein
MKDEGRSVTINFVLLRDQGLALGVGLRLGCFFVGAAGLGFCGGGN